MTQTLFPLLQPPDDTVEPPPLADALILQALQRFEQGIHIIEIQDTLKIARSDLLWIGSVTTSIVEFMDTTMQTLYANQPGQTALLAAINAQNFGFSEAVTQTVASYRRDHATTEDWRTTNGYATAWDAYRAVTRTD